MHTSETRRVDVGDRTVAVVIEHDVDDQDRKVVAGVSAPPLSVEEHTALLGALGIPETVAPVDDAAPADPTTTEPTTTARSRRGPAS